MLADESLQMLVGRGPIAARLFQLGKREQRIVGVRRERILHDHAAIISLGIRGRLRQRTAPEERVTVCGCPLGRCTQQRVHERTTCCAIALAHEPARAPEDRVGGRKRSRVARVSLCVGPVSERAECHDGGKNDSWEAMHRRGGWSLRSGRATYSAPAQGQHERGEQLLVRGELRFLECGIGREES